MEAEHQAPARPRYGAWLRVGGTIAAFAWLATLVNLGEIWEAATGLPAWAVAAALILPPFNLCLATARWWLLLHAYGATRVPSFWHLYRLYLVGIFFNNYLPGGIGGDVARTAASRDAFDGATTPSATVVIVERIIGVAGLLALAGVTSFLLPQWDFTILRIAAASVFIAAVGVVVAVALAPRMSARAPRRLRPYLRAVPSMRRPALLGVVFLGSLVMHTVTSVTAHIVVVAGAPEVTLAQSLVLVPIAMASVYFPFTVGGAGVREAAFVHLFALVGVAEAPALVGSLALWAGVLLLGAVGGGIYLAGPGRASGRATQKEVESKSP